MAIQAGLVGLPNVGKSTLFNALTKSSVPAENFPFCTIDPHIAIAAVPDQRLDKLAKIFGSAKTIPTTMQFVDIAGLVSGAAKGEGLGNKFLSHVMEVDLIIHVLRCFEDNEITHVSNSINPLDDYNTILAELMLKDLEWLEKRKEKVKLNGKKFQNSPKEKALCELELSFVEKLEAALNMGDNQLARKLYTDARKAEIIFQLLSTKQFLIAANLSESDMVNKAYERNARYKSLVETFGIDRVIPVCAKVESELSQMPDEDAQAIRQELALGAQGLGEVIRKTYHELGLITFFTCGPKEAHAWSIHQGTKVPAAAGEIHTDLQRGFICAEVYNAQDLFVAGSEKTLRDTGKIRTEGKEYVVQDGDLLNIRFNV